MPAYNSKTEIDNPNRAEGEPGVAKSEIKLWNSGLHFL
jgi:hypothetical protein